VGIIIHGLLEISFSLQQCKNFRHRLRFDKVIAKVWNHSFFWGHRVDTCRNIHWFQKKIYSFRSTTTNNEVIAKKPFHCIGVTRRLAVLNWRSSSIHHSSSTWNGSVGRKSIFNIPVHAASRIIRQLNVRRVQKIISVTSYPETSCRPNCWILPLFRHTRSYCPEKIELLWGVWNQCGNGRLVSIQAFVVAQTAAVTSSLATEVSK